MSWRRCSLSDFYVKKYKCHIIAVNCIIVGFYEIENDVDMDLSTMVDTLIKLTSPEKVFVIFHWFLSIRYHWTNENIKINK